MRWIIVLFFICSSLAAADLGLHYGNDGQIEQYQDFEQWLGAKLTYRVTFCGKALWTDVTNPWPVSSGGTAEWLADPERKEVISVPLFIAGDNFETDRTEEFKKFANKIKPFGDNVIVRLGWEGNGDWYEWSFIDDPEGFKQCFRRAVAAIHSIVKVTIEWNISCKAMAMDWRLAYPGDDVVDIISIDVYDHWNSGWSDLLNGRAGLKEFRAFCISRNKPEAYTEWGVVTKANGNGDNLVFIENMHNWFQNDNVKYVAYWNTGDVGARIFGNVVDAPVSAAKFRELFGVPAAPKGITIEEYD